MLKSISLQNVASYKSAVIKSDKKVNLIYGLNGTGKSTFSKYLMNPNKDEYKSCHIDGLSSEHEILVYSQDFIKDNFFEPEGLKGIFTLSKTNKDAELKIENAQKEISSLNDALNDKKKELEAENDKIAKRKKHFKIHSGKLNQIIVVVIIGF